jgi:hypothetical protein
MHVVKTLKRAPNPSTTRYPIPTERGGSPPNMDSCPLYLSKGGSSSWTGDDAMMLEQVKKVFQRFTQIAIGKRMRKLRLVPKLFSGSKTNARNLAYQFLRRGSPYVELDTLQHTGIREWRIPDETREEMNLGSCVHLGSSASCWCHRDHLCYGSSTKGIKIPINYWFSY